MLTGIVLLVVRMAVLTMEPEIRLLSEGELEGRVISAETTNLCSPYIQHKAGGDLSCDASGLVTVVNSEAQVDTPRLELNDGNGHHSDEQSVETPREVACSENHKVMEILKWFHSTFSKMGIKGRIALKDFKYMAKSCNVSFKHLSYVAFHKMAIKMQCHFKL